MERSNVFEVPETTIKIVSELLEEAIDLIQLWDGRFSDCICFSRDTESF